MQKNIFLLCSLSILSTLPNIVYADFQGKLFETGDKWEEYYPRFDYVLNALRKAGENANNFNLDENEITTNKPNVLGLSESKAKFEIVRSGIKSFQLHFKSKEDVLKHWNKLMSYVKPSTDGLEVILDPDNISYMKHYYHKSFTLILWKANFGGDWSIWYYRNDHDTRHVNKTDPETIMKIKGVALGHSSLDDVKRAIGSCKLRPMPYPKERNSKRPGKWYSKWYSGAYEINGSCWGFPGEEKSIVALGDYKKIEKIVIQGRNNLNQREEIIQSLKSIFHHNDPGRVDIFYPNSELCDYGSSCSNIRMWKPESPNDNYSIEFNAQYSYIGDANYRFNWYKENNANKLKGQRGITNLFK